MAGRVQTEAARSALRTAIDRITDALGHEYAFTVAAVAVTLWLLGSTIVGLDASVVALVMTVITFMMVFAVQHTSSRESRALNLKMDELIRSTSARNELIGIETESHGQLDERQARLAAEAER